MDSDDTRLRASLWTMTRSAIEHENDLVNHRMTWLLYSQGFLFAVFSVIFVASVKGEIKVSEYLASIILGLISVYGLYLCICVHNSIVTANRQLRRLQVHYNREIKLLPVHVLKNPPLQYKGPTPLLGFGRTESLASATAVVWVILFLTTALGILSPVQSILADHGILILSILFGTFGLIVAVALMAYRAGLQDSLEDDLDID